MRIAITGAAGFVGQHLARHLLGEGHEVVGLAHTPEGRARIEALGAKAVDGDVTKPTTLPPLVQGADAVVHLVAIIRERAGQTFDGVIRLGTQHVADVARHAGVRRFIHQSALGATDEAGYPYLNAKWQAEQVVRRSGVDWTVLRPSILFGEGDHVFTMLADMAAKQPVMPIIGKGDVRLQPLWVGDLARIMASCLGDPATIGQVHELGGPEHVRYEDMVKAAMEASGHRKTLVHVPITAMKAMATAMAWTMRDPPITPGELDTLLRADNVTDVDSVRRHFGFEPTPLREGLRYLAANPREAGRRPVGAGRPGTRGVG